jgi:hypothetical protein
VERTLSNIRARTLILAVLVVAMALFAVGCGDDDDGDTASVSTTTVTETAAADATADDAEEADDGDAEGEEDTEALKEEVTALGKTSTKSDAKPAESSGAYGYSSATNCGAGVYVRTANTSCAFALNVASDFYSTPRYRFYSYSPVTGQTYLVRCTKTFPSLCRAGNGARILITQ